MGIYGDNLKQINEGYFNKLKIGIENIIGNCGKNIYKEHRNETLEKTIKKQTNLEDLKYIRDDINNSIKWLDEAIKKLKNPDKYDPKTINNIKKIFKIKKDTSIEDIEKFRDYVKTDLRKIVNDRIKEVKQE